MLKYQHLSEERLLHLIKLSDEMAFNEIYNRYWPGIFLVALNRMSNEVDAEEIVQDVFCNFWKKRETFELKKTLKAYLAVAVKYEIINRSVIKKKENCFIERFSKKNTELDFSTLETLSFNELKEKLYHSVHSLPERCQLVFRLKLEEDYTQKQIASELDISEKTVEAHLSKARKLLRLSLGSIFLVTLWIFKL